jgi:hypothetical protein
LGRSSSNRAALALEASTSAMRADALGLMYIVKVCRRPFRCCDRILIYDSKGVFRKRYYGL